MASNININDIDTEFPIPGQDNDSQGFRDNFTTILSNFQATKAELEDLQAKAILKSRLEVDSTTNALNEFSETEGGLPISITGANLKAYTETYYTPPGGAVSGSAVINFRNGGYQVFTVGGTTNFTFSNWPSAGRYGKILVHLKHDTQTRTVTFDNTEGSLLFDAGSSFWTLSTDQINSATSPHIIEFWTYDGGSTVYAKYLGQFTTTPGG